MIKTTLLSLLSAALLAGSAHAGDREPGADRSNDQVVESGQDDGQRPVLEMADLPDYPTTGT